ncbi:Ldh family oxidoreductase [Pontiella sulfatireligans]|uniref:Putative oxidoreductase YjmC n=1 Tax=Pontiella sulfatireligans TaxID=2750658 RepID=A0A6C2UNI8_9BACT|nr:Ldh family oxidoreductase [Pontiella sulfatireligans]VGO20884.1 putative oxidoreductase YjmC [Pontiella sulfatireligans]
MLHHISFDYMEKFMLDVFTAIGVPADEAKTCAGVLIASDKRGIDSHGIGRLKPIYYDRIVHQKIQQASTEFEIVRDHLATAVVDGHHGMGMVVAKRCMQMAIDKAKKHGMGMVVARNSTHYGIAGYYPLMACAENMIGISGTNARPSIAPTFGVENMLGTNPLVFGFPTDEPFDFVNDYATSVIQRGKIEQYAREGKDCPEGLIIGRDGKSKTNSKQILEDLVKGEAALAPIGGIGEENGGYKGYGFATVTEVLSAALQQGAFLQQLTDRDANGERKPYQLGHFFIAIDIKCFCEPTDFRKSAGDIMRALRESEKAPGAERIYTCGEKEHLTGIERADSGVPVNEALQKDMITMRNELGLGYKFDFE